YFQQSVEFYKQFIKECENSGITVALENVHESDPEYIRDIIAIINSNNFKACLDIGHCNLHSNLEPTEWIKTYGIMLHHMHIHNNFKDEDSHSSLLNGNIDLIQTFKTIKELNIKPSITFEIFDENALRESVDYFKNNIETL
ncbi:sugar phosphate isomerase/epimerase, partial [bacterium]|nr:sugar phosphate isomerase/epimerase [bacterium]